MLTSCASHEESAHGSQLARRGAAARRCFAAVLLLAASANGASAQMMTTPGNFEVSASGAPTYSIPIAVPPGTAGMKPSLTLEYNSQTSNGMLGVGWSLGGLPTITRCPRTIVQNGVAGGLNFNANDRFCLDGQQFKAISGTYGADGTEYRTEIDSFSRIVSHGAAGTTADDGPAWFEVRTKTGQIMEFGRSGDARPFKGNFTARSWLLNKISDTKGNYLTVTYGGDALSGQAVYPTSIAYTGNADAGLAPYNSVQFVYAARPDFVPFYHGGGEIMTTQRLTNIKTYAGATLVSDYRVSYEQGSGSLRSRITSITACAGDGTCLPATTFTWTNGGTAAFTPVNQTFSGSRPSFSSIVGDVNTDGKSDFLVHSGGGAITYRTFVSNGDGTFSVGSNVNPDPSDNNSEANTRWIAGDFNGDGRTDFAKFNLSSGAATVRTFLANADGTFTLVSQTFPGLTNTDVGPQYPVAGDFDGDGKTDFLLFGGSGGIERFLSVGNGTFVYARTPTPLTDSYPTGSWLVFAGDFNGDGKTDFAAVNAGLIHTYLAGDDGWFTKAANQSMINLNFGSSTFLIGDFNGDGKTDFALVQNASLRLHLSRGDGFFVESTQPLLSSFGEPPHASWTPITGDFNGDGRSDFAFLQNNVLWVYLSNGSATADAPGYAPLTFSGSSQTLGTSFGSPPTNSWTPIAADFNGDGKADFALVGISNSTLVTFLNSGSVPDLLTSITSGLGATTTITYAPLTQSTVYTKDTNATYPVVDMTGPIQVVSRVDTANGIGGTYGTTYSYAGAKSNVLGRFLGFRQMTVQDLQTNIVQTTNFRQDFPFIGMVESVTKRLGAQTLNQSTNSYQFSNAGGAATVSTPSTTSAPYRVSLAQNVASSADLDGTAIPTVTTTNQFDAFNNATQIVVSTPDGFSKTTTNTYVNDVVNWYIGRLTAASVVSQAPTSGSGPSTNADLTISKAHTGTFVQGQTGATYSIVVTNSGTGPTAGTVTVSDTLPSGMAATAISGTGWTCTLGTVSCTRSNALAAGASYPTITLTVNVAANAPAFVTNVASVSGGGDTNTSNNTASVSTMVLAVDPGSQTFTTAGTYSFTVPAHNVLTVQLWGGGGAGQTDSSCMGVGGNAPRNGTQSSFNGTVIAGGGGGGNGAPGFGGGGVGGTASGGDTNINGNVGGAGVGSSGGSAPGGGGGGGASGVGWAAPGLNGAAPGGGGGGGSSGGNGSTNSWPAGGSGAYSQKNYSTGALTVGTSVTVVVGAGGESMPGCLDETFGEIYHGTSGAGGSGRVSISWN